MRDIGKRPAVHKGGRVLQRLHKVWLEGILQKCRHGALGMQLPCRDGLAAVCIAHHDAGKALLQIGKAGGRQKMAITSLATVMSKPSSRGVPFTLPPRPSTRKRS